MKQALLFVSEPDEWKARKRLGQADTITPAQKEILDALDIVEQKVDFSMLIGLRAYNLALLLIAVLVITNGPGVLRVVQGWMGAAPHQAVIGTAGTTSP